MKIVQTAMLCCLAVFALATLALGVHDLLGPAFTDEEIRASLVDTWHVSALATSVNLLALFACGVVASMLWRSAKQRSLRIAAVCTVILLLSSALATAEAHIKLTERATRLTGQSFGGWYGLP